MQHHCRTTQSHLFVKMYISSFLEICVIAEQALSIFFTSHGTAMTKRALFVAR